MTRNDLMQAYYIDREIDSWKHEDQINQISEKLEQLERTRREILSFIMSIDDPQTRLIFKLRCLNNLTWNAVADKVGGMNSEYTVKKRFYRYLDKIGA
ncbi:MAG: hypothetical protein PUE13_05360 [Clostridiales bacterium]|nr:hypothetical protein [Clostridiales bacterium]